MRTFKDTKGREWRIELNHTVIELIKDQIDFDLYDIAKAQPIQRLAADNQLLVKTLYVALEEQIKERELTPEDFGRGMAGDAFDDACTAFVEEYINFFRKADRANMQAAWEATKRAIDATSRAVGERISKLDIDKLVEAGMSTLATSSGSVPAS